MPSKSATFDDVDTRPTESQALLAADVVSIYGTITPRPPLRTADSDISDIDLEAALIKVEPPVEMSSLSRFLRLLWRLALVVVPLVLIGILAWSIATDPNSKFDFKGALRKALGGGTSGAAAMLLQVSLLMPLRTLVVYQYRHGTSTSEAVRTLWEIGGWRRFYSGLGPAMIQGPLARFGDTASDVGVLALFKSNPALSKLPIPVQTVFASITAAAFRMTLTPVDSVKVALQAEGSRGLDLLKRRVHREGWTSLWYGAFGLAASTFAGHYPWFCMYNLLDHIFAQPTDLRHAIIRQAFMGIASSATADTVANSVRVVKTYRQVNEANLSYTDCALEVIRQDGWSGLFLRGLKIRILANGIQGVMFSVLWKLFMEYPSHPKT